MIGSQVRSDLVLIDPDAATHQDMADEWDSVWLTGGTVEVQSPARGGSGTTLSRT